MQPYERPLRVPPAIVHAINLPPHSFQPLGLFNVRIGRILHCLFQGSNENTSRVNKKFGPYKGQGARDNLWYQDTVTRTGWAHLFIGVDNAGLVKPGLHLSKEVRNSDFFLGSFIIFSF